MLIFKLRQPLFNTDDAGGTAPTAPTPIENPLITGVPLDIDPATNAPRVKSAEPPAQEPQAEEIDFGGRKLKVTDPTLKDLHKDWTNLTATATKESQRAKQLETELAQAKQVLANLQNQPPTPEPVQPTPTVTPEKIAAINEKYQEMAYEDPFGAMVWLQQQPEYQQMVKPVYEQNVQSVLTESQKKVEQVKAQLNQNLQVLALKHDDFKALGPAMDTLVNQYPHLRAQMDSNPTTEVMETIYYMAKGLGVQPMAEPPGQPATTPSEPPAAPEPTIEQLLQKPEVIQQLLGNEQVKQTIIQNYLNSVNQKNSQVPVTIGNQPGGQTPAMPEVQPSTVAEAGKAFMAFLRKSTG